MISPFDFKPEHFTQPDADRRLDCAKAYLIALAASPYAYYLDGKIEDIVWGTVQPTRQQKAHLQLCFQYVHSLLTYEEMWDIYHCANMAAGHTNLIID